MHEAADEDEPGPVTERVWSALRRHLDGLGLPTLRPGRQDVEAGRATAYLATPNCPACGGRGMLICPVCDGESRLKVEGCSRCRGAGQIVCDCVRPYSFSIPDQAISGFIACGRNPSGQSRYARLISSPLASRWLPLEGWVWIVGIGLAGAVIVASLVAAGAIGEAVLLAAGTIGLVAGLVRRSRIAWLIASVAVAAALLLFVILGLVAVMEMAASAENSAADMFWVLLLFAAPWAFIVLWLGRWFHPAVRGAFHPEVRALDRLKVRALSLRARLGARLSARRRPVHIAVAATLIALFVIISVADPAVPALARAFAAQTLNRPPGPLHTADVVAFTEPILEDIEAEAHYAGPEGMLTPPTTSLPPLSPPPSDPNGEEVPVRGEERQDRSLLQRLAVSLWLNACRVPLDVCEAPHDRHLTRALGSISEHSRLVEPQVLEHFATVLAQRGYARLSADDWEQAASWWQLVEDYLQQTEQYAELSEPTQPWRVHSAHVHSRQKDLLTAEFLAYGRGSLRTREAWSKAKEGETFVIVEVTLLHLGRAPTEAFSSSFGLRTAEGVRTPLGFKDADGCSATFEPPLPNSLGPEPVECKLAFSVPEDFTSGELLMFGRPVASLGDSQGPEAVEAPGAP
ncbi:MAG: hypothetical protein U9R79_04730 [Armatimonadota bacterium]|nr:hypothetical protein [Armatimonadota bacterium]